MFPNSASNPSKRAVLFDLLCHSRWIRSHTSPGIGESFWPNQSSTGLFSPEFIRDPEPLLESSAPPAYESSRWYVTFTALLGWGYYGGEWASAKSSTWTWMRFTLPWSSEMIRNYAASP